LAFGTDTSSEFFALDGVKLIGLDFSLLGHWTGSALNGLAEDISGFGNHGTFIDDAGTTPDGKSGDALAFDGTGDYVDVGDLAMEVSEDFTISTWIYSDNYGDWFQPVISSQEVYGHNNYYSCFNLQVQFPDGNINFFMGSQEHDRYAINLNAWTSNASLTDGQWHHVAITMENNVATLYLDAVQIDQRTFSGTRIAGSYAVRIGHYNNGDPNQFWNGKLDEIRVFGYALDSTEIAGLVTTDGGASDTDGDGVPDSTDPDDDDDGVPDDLDAFPSDPTESVDTDGDGTGDNADTDDDNDAVLDVDDNCPLHTNPAQNDRDGDGLGDACEVDFAIAVDDYSQLYYAESNGDGSFGPLTRIGDLGGGYSRGVVILDSDNDGDLDFVAGRGIGYTAYFYLFENDGTGSFSNVGEIGTLSNANSWAMDMATGDFNNDGNADFIANGNYVNSAIYLGNGAGNFAKTELNLGGYGRGMDAADFNNDGNLDFARATYSDGRTHIYPGNGDGTFGSPIYVGDTGNDPYGLTAGDFNGDGYVDIIINDGGYGNPYLFAGKGDNSFSFESPVHVPSLDFDRHGSYDAFDYDRDGTLDIVASNYNGTDVLYYPGNGNGTFGAQIKLGDTVNYCLAVSAMPIGSPLDIDGDYILNNVDNCPTIANPDQADTFGTSDGDVCEETDGDGIYDIADNCPDQQNPAQADFDGDGAGDVCDPDDDNDGVDDGADNCPFTANGDQSDIDGNGKGDACDDIDADAVLDSNDNCPYFFNPSQADSDRDGEGNACDPDIDPDGDGLISRVDNCPHIANADQTDSDGNGTGDVCQPLPVTVPWRGDPNEPHQVFSSGTIPLQGVSVSSEGDGPRQLAMATWDPGDGTGPQAVDVSNPLALELEHTYTGSDGQPFTATLVVTDSRGHSYSDTMKVVIRPDSRDTRVNVAIDKGLWHLHKRMSRTTSDGLPSGYWRAYSSYYMAATAGVVQAFEINNHRESGNRLEDPYVDDVARGMRYILSLQHGVLRRIDVNVQNGNDPDTNGNGYGLYIPYGNHAVYLGGQLMDAIVASGTPDKTAETGQASWVKGRKYRDIIQDMLDGYSYGMYDPYGGWYYRYNQGGNDTSASHWWAIGVLAAEVWGMDAPDWVKNLQWTVGVPRMQRYDTWAQQNDGCYFGYTNSWSSNWGDNQTNVTAAGLILMNADDIPQTHLRYTCAMGWLNAKFDLSRSFGNFYTMYQTAKAMRTAQDDTGVSTPIELLDGTRDWYAAYADYLIENQNTYGPGFRSVEGSIGSYIQADMTTSWAIIMLSPSLFELPPVAECSADPDAVDIGSDVAFDGSGSYHLDPNDQIVSYEWDFDDGDTGDGVQTIHAFDDLGTYAVSLTVTDSKGLSSSATCPVQVLDQGFPPNANTGGPYEECIGDPVPLDGSGSSDIDGEIVSYEWDLTTPVNFATVDETAASFDATSHFPSAGVYDIGLRVTDDDSPAKTDSAFSTVTIQADSDNDGTCDPADACPNDPAKTEPGICGCGVADTDSDSDGTADCNDQCPNDSGKTEPGICGCGVADTDSDGDGVADCIDECDDLPAGADPDPNKPGCPKNQRPVAVCQDVMVPADDQCQASADVNGGSSDPDGDPITISASPAGPYSLGTTQVTLTVTDDKGASDTCTATVTVVDQTPPVLTSVPGDIAQGTDDGLCTADVTVGDATATDNCSATVTSDDLGTYRLGDTTVTWTATDGADNSVSATQLITVADDEDPVLTSVPGALAQGTDDGLCTADVTIGEATATDNCSVTVSSDDLGTYTLGDTTVTWTATDGAGNSVSDTQEVTVSDDEDPVFATVPVAISQGTDDGVCSAAINVGLATATDNCSAEVTSDDLGTYALGLSTVTWTATDGAGNSVTATQDIEVVDDEDPILTSVPGAMTQGTDDGVCTADVTVGDATATDNCSVTVSSDDLGTYTLGDTTVTWTATDGAGNSVSDTQEVTISDDEDPVFATVPAAISQGTDDGVCSAAIDVGLATATDNCSAEVTSDDLGTYALGLSTVTWTATDGAGNSVTAIQGIEVVDDEDPVLTSVPGAISQGTDDGVCTAAISVGLATATDNCSVSVSSDDLGTYDLGDATVTWTATDGAGNSVTATQDIEVVDDEDPVLTYVPGAINQGTDDDVCTAAIDVGSAEASDNCSVSVSSDALGTYPLGDTPVTWTATDGADNSVSATQLITIVDDEAPVVADNSAGTMIPPDAPILFTATVTDNCPAPEVVITDYNCWMINGSGRMVDKGGSCVVEITGDTITIVDSGGVGDNIVWDIVGTDGSGNTTDGTGTIVVLNPGKSADDGDANQGVGNGPEDADPGNSNQGDPANSNDENGGEPGSPGKSKGKGKGKGK